MNGLPTDTSANQFSMAHSGLLQPMSMQNLLAMAGIGHHQQALSTPPATTMQAAPSSLCKYKTNGKLELMNVIVFLFIFIAFPLVSERSPLHFPH